MPHIAVLPVGYCFAVTLQLTCLPVLPLFLVGTTTTPTCPPGTGLLPFAGDQGFYWVPLLLLRTCRYVERCAPYRHLCLYLPACLQDNLAVLFVLWFLNGFLPAAYPPRQRRLHLIRSCTRNFTAVVCNHYQVLARLLAACLTRWTYTFYTCITRYTHAVTVVLLLWDAVRPPAYRFATCHTC